MELSVITCVDISGISEIEGKSHVRGDKLIRLHRRRRRDRRICACREAVRGHRSRVLLVEAGGATPPAASRQSAGMADAAARSGRPGPPHHRAGGHGNRHSSGPRRGIGGSSAINAMMFVRGHRDSYADWDQFGAKGWTFDDLLPYFKRSETAAHGDPRSAGRRRSVAWWRPRARSMKCLVAVLGCGGSDGLPPRQGCEWRARNRFRAIGSDDRRRNPAERRRRVSAACAAGGRTSTSSLMPWCSGCSSRMGGAPGSNTARAAGKRSPRMRVKSCSPQAASDRRTC